MDGRLIARHGDITVQEIVPAAGSLSTATQYRVYRGSFLLKTFYDVTEAKAYAEKVR